MWYDYNKKKKKIFIKKKYCFNYYNSVDIYIICHYLWAAVKYVDPIIAYLL